VTFFGAFDCGKSSLLRRLLVDDDIAVPDWLTISARHETFAASDIRYRGAILRDTPGVDPDAAFTASAAWSSSMNQVPSPSFGMATSFASV
jgi:putative ribosome biogenesis GTPase RsgA